MVNGCNAVAKDKAFEDMVSQRDREIVAVLNALRQARLM
jgi:carnitine 3-dehydrogenase